MAQINLAEALQKSLGVPTLQKISPNTQEVKHEEQQYPTHKLSQAAIPAVLTALYLLATSEDGGNIILSGNKSTTWVHTLFKASSQEAVQRVAAYAGTDELTAEREMERVAEHAVRITQENVKDHSSTNKVNEFFTSQKDHILVHLPAALQIGQLLKDDTLDDRTNKMEGPVSGFMHKVEKAFSSATKDTEKGLF